MARVNHPSERSAFEALTEALDHYKRGEADLRTAAQQAGLEEFAFLEEAQALPDPVAKGLGNDLPVFIRDRK
jgi:hypothetical protein